MATFRQLFYNLAATLRKLPFHFETQFNSYYSTAILQSGGYSTNTAIPISKPNSIATVRQLFYNLAATLRKLPLLLRYRELERSGGIYGAGTQWKYTPWDASGMLHEMERTQVRAPQCNCLQ
ncbi:hypothetical protein E4U14_007405 [Claviceps sp. LM454 group G7]|nr:hypothetical protein E4U14_007405 [Claviceps sp. LM454 group G7]